MTNRRVSFSSLITLCWVFAAGRAIAAPAVVTAEPSVWAISTASPPRILSLHGLWYSLYNVEGALAHSGGGLITDVWSSAHALHPFPETNEQLMRYNLVVVANIAGWQSGDAINARLKDYVFHGGSVLILGGNYGFLDYHGSALEELSPVTYADNNGGIKGPGAMALKPADADWARHFSQLKWNEAPRNYWLKPVVAKPGARVVLTADGNPLLVTGTFGKGRVAVFAGSVLGDPPAGELPFWQWSDWPLVLGDTLKWLTEPAPHNPEADTGAIIAAMDAAMGAANNKKEAESKTLARLAPMAVNALTAKHLIELAVRCDDDLDHSMAEELAIALSPMVDAGCGEAAGLLVNSGQTNKAELGLMLLGCCKAPGALGTLQKALQSGDVDSSGGASLEDGSQSEDYGARALYIEVGALRGLGALRDAAALPILRSAMAENAAALARIESAGNPTAAEQLYEVASIAALQCGDPGAAGPAIDAALRVRYSYFSMNSAAEALVRPGQISAALARDRVVHQIGDVRRRELLIEQQFLGLPDNVLPELAKRIAAEPELHVVELALPVFAGRPLSPAIQEILRSSKISAVAELGRASNGG